MATTVTSFISVASGERKPESLTWTVYARPQSMTWYLRFTETGQADLANTFRFVQAFAGAAVASGGKGVEIRHNNNALQYAFLLGNGINSVNSNVTLAPEPGDQVELVARIANTGSVQLFGAVNRGSITTGTASTTLALPTAWDNNTLRVGGRSASANQSESVILHNLLVRRGVISFANMREYAGV